MYNDFEITNTNFQGQCAWCKKIFNERDTDKLILIYGKEVRMEESCLCKKCRDILIDKIESTREEIIYFNNDK